MTSDIKSKLHKLYADASKHSVYQNIPDFVSSALGYSESINEEWRSDRSRLEYLLDHHAPQAGEHWGDFGANTGFFTLSLAYKYPQTQFTAIEVNPNHADFIYQVAKHFSLNNLHVIERSIGLNEISELPKFDFLLHLNVLHHAGHDYDSDILSVCDNFPLYAIRYLNKLHDRAQKMLFQMGSNWGGDKRQPLVAANNDLAKLVLFFDWLSTAGWKTQHMAYPYLDENRRVHYENLSGDVHLAANLKDNSSLQLQLDRFNLDRFPGEFHRRPLFSCE